jgi:hypothetical protein
MESEKVLLKTCIGCTIKKPDANIQRVLFPEKERKLKGERSMQAKTDMFFLDQDQDQE